MNYFENGFLLLKSTPVCKVNLSNFVSLALQAVNRENVIFCSCFVKCKVKFLTVMAELEEMGLSWGTSAQAQDRSEWSGFMAVDEVDK